MYAKDVGRIVTGIRKKISDKKKPSQTIMEKKPAWWLQVVGKKASYRESQN